MSLLKRTLKRDLNILMRTTATLVLECTIGFVGSLGADMRPDFV